MTNEEIKKIQAEIRETQAKLTALQTVANNLTPTEPAPKPWARWKAEPGAGYYHVQPDGSISDLEADRYSTVHRARNEFGNYFKTQLLAERHAKRLRSMVPTCAMPKYGDEYFASATFYSGWATERLIWRDDRVDIEALLLGRVFLTKEAAQAWIAEFGDVWTTRVEGEGE